MSGRAKSLADVKTLAASELQRNKKRHESGY